jgi:S1-C subfamily serine protease
MSRARWAPRRPAALLAVSAVCGALAVSGCGSGDGGSSSAGATAKPAAQPAPQVVVQAADSGFDAARVFREAAPGVVTIRSVFGGGAGLLGGAAEGSGFVLSKDGEIVTNAHVVTDGNGGRREKAEAVFVEFPDRNIVPARIVGFDPFADVALLRVDPDGLDLHPLDLGDDDRLAVGRPVAAIGSPFGEQQSLSVGIVSAMDRSIRSLTRFQIEGAIQTDASINPGNSGGPLLDAAARVVGINQQIETQSGANDGVGFAVPISSVKRSIRQLRADGEAEYAYIGVSSQALYPQLAEKLGIDAAYGGLIAEVVDGGPADEAGLRGGDERIRFQAIPYRAGGDVILAVEGRRVVQPDDLAELISSYEPGETVTLTVLRGGDERRDVEVKLGERPLTTTGG